MADPEVTLSTAPLRPSGKNLSTYAPYVLTHSTEIPSEASIIAAGRRLIESTISWKSGKTYSPNVKTFSSPAGPSIIGKWYCRVSEHTTDQITFDQLWEKMAINKAPNEKEFIPILDKATQVKELSPTAQIWSLHYKFPFPIANRVFTVLQVTHVDTNTPSGLIVSIPIDLSEHKELQKLEEKGERAYYVSVERIQQLENGNTEWRMATSSDIGGLVPKFITEKSMPKSIAEDVPHFFNWFAGLPKSGNTS